MLTHHKFFVLDAHQELALLRATLRYLKLDTYQTVDWDLFLSQLFYALIYLDPLHHHHLKEFANEVAYNDLIFDTHYHSTRNKELLRGSIVRCGLALKDNLMELGAYYLDVFPYQLKAAISDGCLLFSAYEPNPDTPVFGVGYQEQETRARLGD